jgi:GTP:adenosylcobinamide-phosphate guanylyltransferase
LIAPVGLTALVLAGTRPGGDPLAAHLSVTHKALIDICGTPMLERVVRAVAASPSVGRIVVAIERPELVMGLPSCGVPVVTVEAASGPSASVAAALRAEGAPLLVTTGDHALLEPNWIDEFVSAAPTDADAVVALALREAVEASAPGTQRTYLRFADGEYSGCNLFLLRTPAARGVVSLWQDIEAERKRPLAMLQRLGFGYALRYRLGKLTLGDALGRLGHLSRAQIRAVILRDGRAAIDVDKPADLDLVRRLLKPAPPSPP